MPLPNTINSLIGLILALTTFIIAGAVILHISWWLYMEGNWEKLENKIFKNGKPLQPKPKHI